MPGDWSIIENEAIVADYFDMLSKEVAGIPYNKSEHRRQTSRLLNGRSDGAIELKHQNISAILDERGTNWISGYKPRSNYQFALFESVVAKVESTPAWAKVADEASPDSTRPPEIEDVLAILADPPARGKGKRLLHERPMHPYELPTLPTQGSVISYLQREANNRALGLAGEKLVVRFERARLLAAGAKREAEKVKHVSVDIGDGEGFDVHSFEVSGKPRLIEVKTTNHSKDTPFYLSRNEVHFSKANEDCYHLYRLYGYRRGPNLFTLAGAVTESCVLDATQFIAVAS